MIKSIILKDKRINYKIRKSKRAKRLRLAVYCDGSVIVTQPRNISLNRIEYFIKVKSKWILNKLDFFNNLKRRIPKGNYEDYIKNKERALNQINIRAKELNKTYGYKFNKINIKNQKTRWGSCSIKRNLNFNYRLIYLPNRIIDYVVVHELCHLKEFNHSKRFWSLVEKGIPDYKDIKKEFKNKGLYL